MIRTLNNWFYDFILAKELQFEKFESTLNPKCKESKPESFLIIYTKFSAHGQFYINIKIKKYISLF